MASVLNSESWRQNQQREGIPCGTLDDCHTNVYALTELSELRWRVYEHAGNTSTLTRMHEDPIVKAYGRCLQNKLLCTFRRQPQPTAIELKLQSFLDSCPKELWVFWLSQDEPPTLATSVAGLNEKLQTTMDPPMISLEVRHMLFNALYTYLSNGFSRSGHLRFGRWHTKPLRQPLPGREHMLPRFSIGYNLRFFVAGMSTVCCAVVSQKQPALFRLTKQHIDLKEQFKVILAPWSLSAVFVSADLSTYKIDVEAEFARWKQYWFPHWEDGVDEPLEQPGVPLMVVVEADQMPLLYPSCMIGVTWDECPLRRGASSKVTFPSPPEPEGDPDKTTDKTIYNPFPHDQIEILVPGGGERNRVLIGQAEAWPVLEIAMDEAHTGRRKLQESAWSIPPIPAVQANDEERFSQSDAHRAANCGCGECQSRLGRQDVENPEDITTVPEVIEKVREKAESYVQYQEGRRKIREIENIFNNPSEAEKCPYDIQVLKTVLEQLSEKEREMEALTVPKSEKAYREMKRKQKRYSREQAKTSSLLPHFAPFPSSSSDEDSDDETTANPQKEETGERSNPSWSNTKSNEGIHTGIFCYADVATYHFPDPLNSPTNSSDDESYETTPFTPVRVVSPCYPNGKYCGRSSPVKAIESTSDSHPPSASYHSRKMLSRRSGKDRRKRLPMPGIDLDKVVVKQSAELSSLQENRTAQLADKWPYNNPRILEAQCSTTEDRMNGKDSSLRLMRPRRPLPLIRKKDIIVRGPIRGNRAGKRRSKGRASWPSCENFDVTSLVQRTGEDIAFRIELVYPKDRTEELESDEEGHERGKLFLNSIGTPSTSTPAFNYNASISGYPQDDAMNADECMMATQVGAGPHSAPSDFLSPPASNERDDHMIAPGSVAPFPRGPPSVPLTDAQMNNIYPTPPSVLVDTQQPSPQQLSIPSTSQNQPPSLETIDVQMIETRTPPVLLPILAKQKPSTSKPEPIWKDEPIDDDVYPSDLSQDMGEVVNFVKENPIHARNSWNELPKAMRYAVFGQVKLKPRSGNLPDYEKVKLRFGRGSGKRTISSIEKLAAALSNRTNANQHHQQGQQQGSMVGMHRMAMGHPMAHPQRPIGPMAPQMRMGYGNMGGQHPVQQLSTMVNNPMYGGGMGGYQGMQPGGPMPHHMGMGGHPQMGINPAHMGAGMGPGGQMMPPTTMGPSGQIIHNNMYYPRGGGPPGGYGSGLGGDHMGYHPMGMQYGQGYQPAPSHGHPTYGAPPMPPPHLLQRSSSAYMNSPHHPSVPTPSSTSSASHLPSTPVIVKQEIQDIEPIDASASLLPSFPLSLLLSDSILNLHYDSTFDACPICSCNASIRARELGLYISPDQLLMSNPQTQMSQISPWSGFYIQGGQLNTCTCGFSAIRYRLLSMRSGLFPEDAREATGEPNSVAEIDGGSGEFDAFWFTLPRHEGREAMNMLDLLRRMSLHRDLASLISRAGALHSSLEKAVKPKNEKDRSEYVISNMDQTELLLIWQAALGALMPSKTPQPRADVSAYFHPWGLQTAKEVFDVAEAECRALLNELKTSLDESMRSIRSAPQTPSLVEGPLTWRSFAQKCIKSAQDDEKEISSTAEPVPCVMVAGERENAPIRAAPSIVRFWESVSLGPVDQPKDVFYLAITLDDPELSERTNNYLEEMSRKYEQMRFGKHLPLPTSEQIVKGGVMRIERTQGYGMQPTSSLIRHLQQYNHQKGGPFDPQLIARLHSYCGQLEHALISIFTKDQYTVFERESFRRAATEQYRSRSYLMSFYAKSMDDRLRIREREAQAERNEIFRKAQLEKLIVDIEQVEEMAQADEAREARKSGAENDKDQETALDPMQELMEMPDMRQEEVKSEPIDANANQGTVQLGQPQPPMTPQKNGIGQEGNFQMTGNNTGSNQHSAQDSTRTSYTSSFPGGIPSPLPIVPPLPPEDIPDDESGVLPHVIVIYVVDPFSMGGRGTDSKTARLLAHSYMRTFNCVCQKLPLKLRTQVQLEIIPASQLLDHYAGYAQMGRPQFDHVEKMSAQDCLRDLCLSVYSQSRVLLPECVKTILPKSMTKFGPASQLSEAIEQWGNNMREQYLFQVPSNPWHLAPPALMHRRPDGQTISIEHGEQVMYVSYCLLGGDWLCASITDSLGKIQDNCLINLKPNNPDKMVVKYRRRTQILDAMERLWTYIQGNLVVATKCWRLVIGKLGRIGHAEFRAWSTLLSKTNLKRQNQKLKETCHCCQCVNSSCSTLHQGTPIILSACLVSLEPEPNLKVLSTSLSHTDAKNRTKGPAYGPEDASVTHILVFPTSVDIQFGAGDNLGQAHEDDDNLNLDFEIGIDDLGEMSEMNDIIDQVIEQQNGQPQTAGIRNPHGGFFENFEHQIENQPLATGFFVSTAPASDLPDWFWTSCPNAKGQTPVHLKSSLHINVTQVQQDDSFGNVQKEKNGQGNTDTVHPLDSNRTDEVLRHVLETYNALSWLSIDSVSGERKSCLPVHMQALLRLYHSVAKFIA